MREPLDNSSVNCVGGRSSKGRPSARHNGSNLSRNSSPDCLNVGDRRSIRERGRVSASANVSAPATEDFPACLEQRSNALFHVALISLACQSSGVMPASVRIFVGSAK